MSHKPTITVLVGFPASGKSYYRNNVPDSFVVVSSDDFIEKEAAARNLTYSEIFGEYAPIANRLMMAEVHKAWCLS